jgi:hypothetical protein
MARKVWISFPLIRASETSDAAVVSFLKGGLKKELELEAAAFITKWMFDKDVPFSIDFDSATVDRNLVMAALPKRIQKALGVAIPVVVEAGQAVSVEATAEVVEAVEIDESEAVETADAEETTAVKRTAEVPVGAAERSGGDSGSNGPVEPL